MTHKTIQPDEVLRSIEFELLQGTISHDDLGAGIHTARQYQNKVRSELMGASKDAPDIRETAIRLFQINEMLLTLIQELNAALLGVQADLHRMRQTAEVTAQMNVSPVTLVPEPATVASAESTPTPLPADVRRAMRSEALQIEMDVQPVTIPLIGGLLRRLRFMVHDLVLFYLRRLAGKQAAVNQTYGEWVLHLVEKSERQQIQIEILAARLAALEARLAESGQAAAAQA